MSRELFGTDGVRGLAGQYPLDSDGSRRIGMAVGTQFAQPGQQVIIACDTRESSAQIVADLVDGLTSVGVNAVNTGVLPTPGLAYLTRQTQDFVAGIMVTASHNPYQYNGIKVFDRQGNKLTDEVESELNTLIDDGAPERGPRGSSAQKDLSLAYEEFLVGSVETDFKGISLALDTANGAASGLASRVLEKLGANVTAIFDSPDGRNINADCGATDTRKLQAKVTADNLALGIALDGDADRVIMVDDRGREVKGDHILYILAVSNHCDGVVATFMSNLGFEQALTKRSIELKRTQVGDRYVLEGLAETGYKLGGEQSGHIIMPELLKTGDGLLAAIQVIGAIGRSGKSLSEWCDEVELLPQALVNIPLADKSLLDSAAIQAFLKQQSDQFAGQGRLLIRPSGTEPLARVMVEAPDAQTKAEHIASQLSEIIERGKQ